MIIILYFNPTFCLKYDIKHKKMSKHRSIQQTTYPPGGWMAKPNQDEANALLKLAIWKVRLNKWQHEIHNRNEQDK